MLLFLSFILLGLVSSSGRQNFLSHLTWYLKSKHPERLISLVILRLKKVPLQYYTKSFLQCLSLLILCSHAKESFIKTLDIHTQFTKKVSKTSIYILSANAYFST